MIDIIFVIPSSSKEAYQDLSNNYSAIEPPTWALLLANAVRTKGFKPIILDCEAERFSDEVAIKKIKQLNPRLVCFTLYGQNPNAGTTSMIGGTRLGKELKKKVKGSKICFVGSHVSALPKEVLEFEFVDFVLLNEGVYALCDLLESDLINIKNIDGIGYKDKNNNLILSKVAKVVPQDRMDIDMPGYAWDLLPKKEKPLDLYRAHYWHTNFKDKDRTPFASIYTSLGCQFACSFCMINIINRNNNVVNATAADFRGMRFWSPELILNELGKLHEMGVKTIRLADEMFFLNKKYYVPILKGIIDRGYDFNMWAYARVDTIRSDQLQLFKKAGINWLCLGIEAGNQNVRFDIEKGKFKDLNIRDVVKQIESHKIEVLGNYMFGFPTDNLATMQETLDLALELNTAHANFYATQALPGSPLYFQAKKNGWDIPKRFEEYAFLSYDCKPLPTNFLNAKDVLQFRDNAWHKYFSSPAYLKVVENKFGFKARKNVEKMSQIKLKRKMLEN